MNYYQYRRRVPEARRSSDYIKPIVAVVVFIAVIVALWKLLGAIFGGGDDTQDQISNVPDEKVHVEVEMGSAKVMAAEAKDFEPLTRSIDIFEGETVQTLSDGRLSLAFFDGTTGRLDKDSTLAVDTLAQQGSDTTVGMTLEEGGVWVDTTRADSSSTTVMASTDHFKVTADSGAKFALEAPGSLYVLEGEVEADILDGSDVLKTVNVEQDQQLVLTDSIIADLVDGGDNEIIFALDDNFTSSTWYEWNVKMDGGLTTDEGNKTDEEKADDENKDEEDKTEEDSNTEGSSTPEITSPGENGDEVTLDKTSLFISGTVSADTEKVKVNEYVLNQYTPGSKKFTYKADVKIGNLKVGDNVFKVYAIDEEGNESKAATITLVLPQSVYDEADTEEKSENTGTVSITSPNGGNDLVTNETTFVISGKVPSGTATVKVNGYQLQAFKVGNTTFNYNANTTLGTLKAGQKNVFEVVAYDEDGKMIGTDSMTIDLSGGADTSGSNNTDNQAPSNGPLSLSITMPTTASAYQTTLNQITLGGAVSGAPEAVYVNGNKVEGYLNGAGKWSMTVTLQPGDNQFSVYAEKEGQTTPADTITVTYSG